MRIRAYQLRARLTDPIDRTSPEATIPSLLGLASEASAILDVYKRYLRDRLDLKASKEQVARELGDVLWYVASIATAYGLNLERIAKDNLKRARDLYPGNERQRTLQKLLRLDPGYPPREVFPRSLIVHFKQARRRGRPTAVMFLVDAYPNSFGKRSSASDSGFAVGQQIGADLDDNTRRENGYRFHDAIHMGFLAVLGWSPTMRKLLGLKRKSDPETDNAEDGARAIFAEEGLSAVLSRMAPRRAGFENEANIDGEAVEIARAATEGLEVARHPAWVWKPAICTGFRAMHRLLENGGGYLHADLDEHKLTYSKTKPGLKRSSRSAHPSGK